VNTIVTLWIIYMSCVLSVVNINRTQFLQEFGDNIVQ
jgi:hypothetical protein